MRESLEEVTIKRKGEKMTGIISVFYWLEISWREKEIQNVWNFNKCKFYSSCSA